MFGIVTKTQLRQHAHEISQQVEAARRDIDALKFEWNSMYDKFRTMLARWVKRDRDKDNGDDGAPAPETEERAPAAHFPRSRRGF